MTRKIIERVAKLEAIIWLIQGILKIIAICTLLASIFFYVFDYPNELNPNRKLFSTINLIMAIPLLIFAVYYPIAYLCKRNNKTRSIVISTIKAIIACAVIGFMFITIIFLPELKAINLDWLEVVSGSIVLIYGLIHALMLWDTKKRGAKEEYAKYKPPFITVSILSIVAFTLSIIAYLK